VPSVTAKRQCVAILRPVFALLLIMAVAALSGCAYGGGGIVTPAVVIDFTARMAAAINDAFYYFIAIDADGDFGQDGPVAVAAGPDWGNGWGTGSFTHYIEYHLGQYMVYQVNRLARLITAGGGITAVAGSPTNTSVGTSTLTVKAINYGAATVTGAGMVSGATNTGLQSAGTLALETNAAGETVAGSVSFTPAASGGRALTAGEQAVIDNLNAGGVALQTNSLAGLGLTLTLNAAQAGTQTITVAPTTADVENRLEPVSGAVETINGQLQANTINGTGNTVIPGATITTGDFVQDGKATVRLDLSPVATPLGPPFAYTLPAGSSTLRATLDLATLGNNIPDLSVNVITTTELIFDENVTDPNEHTYDGLGRLGNRYVTFRTDQYQTINNNSGLFEQELAGDSTLAGPATAEEQNQVDIVDWSVTIRRLR